MATRNRKLVNIVQKNKRGALVIEQRRRRADAVFSPDKWCQYVYKTWHNFSKEYLKYS